MLWAFLRFVLVYVLILYIDWFLMWCASVRSRPSLARSRASENTARRTSRRRWCTLVPPLSLPLSFSLRTSVALFLLPTLHRWWWEIYYETRSVWPLDGGKSECTIHRRLCVVQIYRYYYWEVYIICGACACVPAACESTRAMTVNGMRFVRGESTCRVAAETRNKKPDARAYLQLDCCFTIVVVVVLRIFALNT